MIPPKLKAGDEIRIIAPSHSIPADFSESMRQQAIQGLEKLGLKVTFGKYVDEVNEFETTTVEHRLFDLHEAYADPKVKGVLAATGGSSVTQILSQIDYDLVRQNFARLGLSHDVRIGDEQELKLLLQRALSVLM